jgi:hypothetical protein
MIKIILEVFILMCFTIAAFSLLMLFIESFEDNKISRLKLYDLPIQKTRFVQLVIDWCHDNIAFSNTQKPIVSLKYYKHKKFAGLYYSRYHECIIYVNKHVSLQEVTNTIIHEYVHARQRSKTFDKMYHKYQIEIGYENNPFEVEARDVAKKHEKECLKWVFQQIQFH